eukprot:IDg20237t1
MCIKVRISAKSIRSVSKAREISLTPPPRAVLLEKAKNVLAALSLWKRKLCGWLSAENEKKASFRFTDIDADLKQFVVWLRAERIPGTLQKART